jgi:hypothetical protein
VVSERQQRQMEYMSKREAEGRPENRLRRGGKTKEKAKGEKPKRTHNGDPKRGELSISKLKC